MYTFLWKESLNSDGHHFYQQNEQSPLILADLKHFYEKKA
jgi:hypothetical protein